MFGWLRSIFSPKKPRAISTQFHTSIVGVSHRNRDQTSRQKIIREDLYLGMGLMGRNENDNPIDPNAVAVDTPGGKQIGYLNSRLAADVRAWIAAGATVTMVVTDLTGGTDDKPTRGMNVLLTAYEPEDEE